MDIGTAQSVLLSGIVLGSLYALMATGLSLIWTTLGIFNFGPRRVHDPLAPSSPGKSAPTWDGDWARGRGSPSAWRP